MTVSIKKPNQNQNQNKNTLFIPGGKFVYYKEHPARLQCMSAHSKREIIRFQMKFSVIKLTTPFHFPVSISVHSPTVKFMIFRPCFPPEPILGAKIKALCTVCPLTAD